MGEQSTFEALLADGRIVFPRNGDGSPRKKYFQHEREQEGQCDTNWWSHAQCGHNQGGSEALRKLLGENNVFNNPKPIELMEGIIQVSNAKDEDIVMDFFCGSGTIAHAVMETNQRMLDSLRYILIQLPEPLKADNKEQSAAALYCDKLGRQRNIAELTKERLRRSANKIREDASDYEGDLGFRVFKLDKSNIRAWDPAPDNLEDALRDAIDHIRPGRTEQDILYELLLKLGLDLCAPIETREVAGKTVHSAVDGTLIACLDKRIASEEAEPLASGIADWHAQAKHEGETTVIFRDSAFVNDIAKTNTAAILNQRGLKNVRSL